MAFFISKLLGLIHKVTPDTGVLTRRPVLGVLCWAPNLRENLRLVCQLLVFVFFNVPFVSFCSLCT